MMHNIRIFTFFCNLCNFLGQISMWEAHRAQVRTSAWKLPPHDAFIPKVVNVAKVVRNLPKCCSIQWISIEPVLEIRPLLLGGPVWTPPPPPPPLQSMLFEQVPPPPPLGLCFENRYPPPPTSLDCVLRTGTPPPAPPPWMHFRNRPPPLPPPHVPSTVHTPISVRSCIHLDIFNCCVMHVPRSGQFLLISALGGLAACGSLWRTVVEGLGPYRV